MINKKSIVEFYQRQGFQFSEKETKIFHQWYTGLNQTQQGNLLTMANKDQKEFLNGLAVYKAVA